MNCARRVDDGVDIRAGVERARDIDPVVPERLQDRTIAGQVGLGQARGITQRGSDIATETRTSSPIASFPTNPRAGVSRMTFIRNRRASNRLSGWNSLSCSRG